VSSAVLLAQKLYRSHCISVGRDTAVGVATRYGLDGPGIKFQRGEVFRTRPDRLWGPPSFLYIEYRVISGGEAAGVWRYLHIPT